MILLIYLMIVTSLSQCTQNDKQFLVTFHPHLDAFWLNIDDDLKNIDWQPTGFLYDMNQRNSKQILNSMLTALKQKSIRKYFVTEVVFLKDWYLYLNEQEKLIAKKLLKQGQLEIANAGWVENDEAVCYYDDILHQYTVGQNFMYQEFEYITKIGWSTDSFGHSHSQASLQSLLGLQFQGIERVDDRYINQHNNGPLLQFYWQAISDSNNLTYPSVLTQVRHFLHEVNNLRQNYNITFDFKTIQKHMLQIYEKPKLFRFLGNDFEQFVTQEFTNLEDNFNELNKDTSQTCPEYKYGNPSDYLQLIKLYWSKNIVPTRKYDLLPNWDQERYWTGFYTTDPILKGSCKQFSGIINLHRKLLFRKYLVNQSLYSERQDLLNRSNQLLAVMQHHDGITATSKTYIQAIFKERMKNVSIQLQQDIKKLYKLNQTAQVCQLFRDNNRCTLLLTDSLLRFTVFHQGIQKTQRIEIQLPQGIFYAEMSGKYSIFCKETNCTLVLYAFLRPGKNQFLLTKTQKRILESLDKVIKMQSIIDTKSYEYNRLRFTFTDDGVFRYESYNNNFMQLTYQTADAMNQSRNTKWWDKYGVQYNKDQYIQSGMYILFNNGNLTKMKTQIEQAYAGAFKSELRIYVKFNKNFDIEFVINPHHPNIVDIRSLFTVPNQKLKDYYLRIKSNVNQTSEFYHDSNGFLVAKRILNSRPDYEFQHKQQDKINQNTYPACSFAYIKDSNKKLIIFTDRARGISLYDGSLIVNIDRICSDDGKGVGQAYMKTESHTYNLKVGIMGSEKDVQRQWQRNNDQSLVGFWQPVDRQDIQSSIIDRHIYEQNYLKYTVHFLNKNQVAFRIQNLAEFRQLKLKKTPNQLIIDELNVTISPKDMKITYANGLPIRDKKKWIDNEVTINSMLQKDTDKSYVLSPLQIRTFRINMKQPIKQHKKIQEQQVKPNKKPQNKQHKSPFLMPKKRCF